MSLNSVNTNINAYVALQSLNQTSSALASAQKQISTGYRVADASDDGAAFSVAQKVRADVSGLTAVTQQLGNANGLVGVAQTALTTVSTDLASVKKLLVDIANNTTSTDQRSQYVVQYQNLVSQIADAIDSSVYNGQTLLGNTQATSGSNLTGTTGSSFAVVTDENGTESTISAADQSTVASTLLAFIGGTFYRTQSTSGVNTDAYTSYAAADYSVTGTIAVAAETALASTASSTTSFSVLQTYVNTFLNNIGSDNNFINATITFTNNKIDSLNSGLGSLIDADLTKESAVLQSLQIKQQLGTQALSIANQSPQTLLSLFK